MRSTDDTSADGFVTVRALADDWQTSSRTVLRLIADGALPAHRIGRQLRIRRSDVADYLDRVRTGARAS